MDSSDTVQEPQATNQVVIVAGKFMDNFDPELIGTPSETPPGYIEGVYPKWDLFGGRSQLFDPIAKIVIAYYDYKYKGQMFFFERGYLRVNPQNSGEWCFVNDATKFPYKRKIGKACLFEKVLFSLILAHYGNTGCGVFKQGYNY